MTNEQNPDKAQAKAKINKNELKRFLAQHEGAPIIVAYTDGEGAYCFAGRFPLEKLCLLKEVITRKVDFMLGQAIKTGVDFHKKAPGQDGPALKPVD